MAQYDGSIRICTKIDEKGFQAGSKDLEAGARRLAKSVSDSLGEGAKIALQKQTDAFIKLNQQYANQEQKVKDLAEKLHDLQRQKVETAEFKKLSKDLDKSKASLDRLYDRRDSYVELDKKTPPKLELDISDAERKIKILEADIKELVATDKAYVPADTSKARQEIAAAEQKQMQMYSALQNAADSLGLKITQNAEKEESRARAIQEESAEEERLAQIRENAVVGNQRIVEVVERRKQLLKEIADMEAAGIGAGYQQYDAAKREIAEAEREIRDYRNGIEETKEKYKKLGNVAAAALSRIGSMMKKASISSFGLLSKEIKKAASSMSLFGKSTKSSNNMLNGGLKSILKYGLGIRSLYALISKFRTAVKEGFGNLAQYSAPVNAALSSLKSASTQLKNSLATAFAPILTAIAPALTVLINLASRAATAVGMLIAALTGQKTFTKAKSVQEDYAASLGKTASSAKEAEKALKGYLSPIDEINKMEKQDTSAANGGGGGAGAGIGDMFEIVDISSKIKDFADMLKKAWEKADFTEIGALIGTKLKDALDNIPWDKIQATAAKFGKSFATLINGFVEVKGLGYTIGKAIGEAINTGIAGINAFLDNTHWDSVGKFIGKGLNGVVDTIDWKGLGHLFAAKWNAIFKTLGTAARTFKWKEFGKKLADSINTWIRDFDWIENGTNLSDLAKGLLDSLVTLLEKINWQELGDNVADFVGSVDWNGIMVRLSEDIGAALGGVSAFLVGLFKDAWDSYESWVIEEIKKAGGNIFLGMLYGIADAAKGIGNWIKKNIFDPFIKGFKNAFGIHSPSTVMQEQGSYIISGLMKGILDKWSEFINFWIEKKNEIIKKFNDIKEKFIQKGKNIIEGIKSGIVDKWSDFSSYWSERKRIIIDKFKDIKEKFLTKGRNIISGIKSGISEKFSSFSAWWGEKRDSIVKKFDNIREKMASVGRNIVNGIIDGIKSIWSTLAGLAQKIIDLFTIKVGTSDRGTTASSSTSSTSPQAVSAYSATMAAFSSAPIPALARGAVIPPNKEFLAVLGDQKHGTNIEAPLDTIKQANRESILEVLSELGLTGKASNTGSKTIKIPIILNGKQILEAVITEAQLRQAQNGQNPLVTI